MGLTSKNLRYLLMLKKKYDIKGPVLIFGNQDIYATEKEILKWLGELGLQFRKPKKIHYSTSGVLEKINKEASRYLHAKTFFEFLGIPEDQYYDIDKFDFDKPVILHDLEKPMDAKYNNFFSFILDSGTLEHIFDIKSVMENVVRVAKLGGYVLLVTPAQNFLNHGFYQFSPTFFYDFFPVNGFEIVEANIIELRGTVDRFYKYDQERDYYDLFFDPVNRLVNSFLVRKVEEVDKIVSPTQKIFVDLQKGPDKTMEDFNRNFLGKVVAFFRKVIPIKFHGMFFKWWVFLKRKTTRRKYFDIRA